MPSKTYLYFYFNTNIIQTINCRLRNDGKPSFVTLCCLRTWSWARVPPGWRPSGRWQTRTHCRTSGPAQTLSAAITIGLWHIVIRTKTNVVSFVFIWFGNFRYTFQIPEVDGYIEKCYLWFQKCMFNGHICTATTTVQATLIDDIIVRNWNKSSSCIGWSPLTLHPSWGQCRPLSSEL